MPNPRTVCLVEIADILGVTHQRTSVIVRAAGLRRAGRPGRSEPPMGSARGLGVDEGVAAGGAVAIADREPHQKGHYERQRQHPRLGHPYLLWPNQRYTAM
jgi:hypothetical protein